MVSRAVLFLAIFAKFLDPNDSRKLDRERCKEIPYIVYLNIFHTHTSECAGSIITSSWVITAAHCVHYNESETVQISVTLVSDIFESNVYYMDKLVPHPKYNEDTFQHDIALVSLNEPIQEKMTYPVLVKTKLESDKCTKGIAGWQEVSPNGNARAFFKCANITLCPKKGCTFSKEILNGGAVLDGTKVYGIMKGNESSTAHEDSGGGPLTCNGKLIGITSLEDEEQHTNRCVVYTKIESYFKFIAKHTGLNLPPWEPTDLEYAEDSSNTITSDKHEEQAPSSYNNSLPNPVIIILLIAVLIN